MANKTEAQIKKDLIDLKIKNDIKRHEMKMQELEFARKTESIHHLNEMEMQKIKTAEIKKVFDRKQASQYPRGRSW